MTHVVVFRTGGTANFIWAYSLAMSEAEALASASTVRRMGYAAHVEPVGIADVLGPPTTFTVSPVRDLMIRARSASA